VSPRRNGKSEARFRGKRWNSDRVRHQHCNPDLARNHLTVYGRSTRLKSTTSTSACHREDTVRTPPGNNQNSFFNSASLYLPHPAARCGTGRWKVSSAVHQRPSLALSGTVVAAIFLLPIVLWRRTR
jgi:hypothetical protein